MINVKKNSLDCKPYESENHTYKKANIIVVSLIFLDRRSRRAKTAKIGQIFARPETIKV